MMLRLLPIAVSLLSILGLVAAWLFLRSGPTGWDRAITRDPETDAVAYDFHLRSLDGDALLALHCTPNAPIAVVVTADDPPGAAGAAPQPRPARLALDGEPASVREVIVSDRAISLTDGDPVRAHAFVTRLGASRRLDLALDPSAGGPGLAASFATVGTDDVVNELRETCL